MEYWGYLHSRKPHRCQVWIWNGHQTGHHWWFQPFRSWTRRVTSLHLWFNQWTHVTRRCMDINISNMNQSYIYIIAYIYRYVYIYTYIYILCSNQLKKEKHQQPRLSNPEISWISWKSWVQQVRPAKRNVFGQKRTKVFRHLAASSGSAVAGGD